MPSRRSIALDVSINLNIFRASFLVTLIDLRFHSDAIRRLRDASNDAAGVIDEFGWENTLVERGSTIDKKDYIDRGERALVFARRL